MNTVDQRIVSMQFDNKRFESGAKTSMDTLQKLKKSIEFAGSEERLNQLYKNGKLFSLEGIAQGVDSLASRFSILGIVGMTVIQDLTNMALSMGKKVASFVWEPLVAGGRRRSEAIEQAKFQFKGLGMDVESTMQSALDAVKGTAYGLGDAALVAAQLGASGMRAGEQMTTALRGVAGVAAMTGSAYADIGGIFTTVAGNGRLMGDQLRQLSYKGINAAATIGKYLNKTEAEVRDMVSKGKISFEIFSDAMDSAFGEHSQDANKLFSGALANMQAALSRIGAVVWTAKLEDYRDVLNSLSPVIDQVNEGIRPLLDMFNALHRAVAQKMVGKINWFSQFLKDYRFLPLIVEGIQHFVKQVLKVGGAIRKAFTNVFPPATAKELMIFAHGFKGLMEQFIVSKKATKNIEAVFTGFFSVIRVGLGVVSGFAQVIFALLKGFGPLFEILGKIAGGFGQFLSGISEGIFSMNIFGATVDSCSQVGQALSKVFGQMNQVLPFFAKVAQGVGKIVEAIFGGITRGVNGLDIEKVVRIINGILTGVLLKNLGDFVNKVTFMTGRAGPFAGLIGIFDNLKIALFQLQGQLKAAVLMKIAQAVAVLVAAMWVLSKIDKEKLTMAVGLVGGMFATMFTSMELFASMTPLAIKSMLAVQTLASAMQTMAISVLILSFAMKNLAGLDWAGVAKGLVGIGGLLALLVVSAKALNRSSTTLAKSAGGFVIFAVAINLLARALKTVGELSWSSVIKGVTGLGLLGAQLIIFSKMVGKSLTIKTSMALILLSAALNGLASAVSKLGTLSIKTLTKGLSTISILLLQMGIFVKTIGTPKKVLATAFAMNLVAAALVIISTAVKTFGKMSLAEIGKGLLGLGGALMIIAVAMKFMMTALPGAAALLVVAGAMAIFAPVLKTFGNMSMKQIGKSLAMLAGAFVVLGVAAAVLTPLLPSLIGLALSVALIGAGCALAGVGLIAVAAGLTALSVAGAAGAAALVGIVSALISLIPAAMKQLGFGFVEFVKVIANSGKAITDGFVTILSAVLDALIQIVPKVIDLLVLFITEGLKALVTVIPAFVKAGAQIILGVLQGIAEHIGDIVEAGVDVAINFIQGLIKKLPDIIQTGFDFVIGFINGVANSIRKNNQAVIDAVWNLLDSFVDAGMQWLASVPKGLFNIGKGIISGITDGMKGGFSKLGSTASNIGTSFIKTIKKTLGINSPAKEFVDIAKYSMQGLIVGIKDQAASVLAEAKSLGSSLITTIQKATSIATSDVNLSPVIAPVLDLTGVEKGTKTLDSLLEKSNILSPNGSFNAATSLPTDSTGSILPSNQNGSETVYSFVQNNYSPKSLSRLDIYRQTKNQFATLKGMVNA